MGKLQSKEGVAIMEEIGTCKGCAFWKPETNEPVLAENSGKERGRCHKNAPKATPVVMPVINEIAHTITHQVLELTVWPVTMGIMWCGQFKPKPNSEENRRECERIALVKETELAK